MTIVQTDSGPVRGASENGLAVFKGIPYAASPVGDLRWMPPQPPVPWTEPRDALEFGDIAPQEKSPLLPPVLAIDQPESEDCLYLNVYTPAADGGACPVMLWIHGGGFYLGAGSQDLYEGRGLASRGVVVVTINYRMGPFSRTARSRPRATNALEFGGTPRRARSNSRTARSRPRATLEWVRNNVAAFGGDPGNVTIFGESAGGMSVATLLTMPAAQGLFHKAIVQSGPGHTHFSVDEALDYIAKPMLEALGTSDPEALRAATTEELMEAIPSFMDAVASPDPAKRNGWAKPVVDGETSTDWPEPTLATGAHGGLPLMVGTTRDEMSSPVVAGVAEDDLVDGVAALVSKGDAGALVEAYRAARGHRLAPVDAGSLYSAIETSRMMGVPSTRLLDAHRPHGPVYHYVFDWISPQMDGASGAQHGVDIGFVFGTHDVTPDAAAMFGAGPAADALASATMDAWTAFARTGDPSTESLGAWPPYGETRATMMIGPLAGVREAPFEGERAAWDGIATSDMR